MSKDSIKAHEAKRPQYTSNFLSAMHFFPANSLVNTGAKRVIELNDIWELGEEEGADELWRKTGQSWAESKKSEKPSLAKTLFSLAPGILIGSLFLMFLNMMAGLVPSIVLPYLIDWMTFDQASYDNISAIIANAAAMNVTLNLGIQLPTKPDHPEEYWGWIYAAIIGFSGILAAYFENHGILLAQKATTRIRGAAMMLVYDKALKASPTASPPSGKVVNLLTSDIAIIDRGIFVVVQYLMAPLQVIAIMVLLWRQLEAYSLISLGVLILLFPFSALISRKMFGVFSLRQTAADTRIKLITELVNAIRIIKYYAWEKPMGDTIKKARSTELKTLRGFFFWIQILIGMNSTGPVLATGLTFIFYGLFATPSLTKIFTAVNLLTNLRSIFMTLPQVFQQFSLILASVGRIQEYLLISDAELRRRMEGEAKNDPVVEVKDASFSWSTAEDSFSLKDISVTVSKGSELTMVAGLVGSGKSTFAQALLGQVTQNKGDLNVRGRIAYVPQTAWIMNASVRDNILFGKPYDAKKYDRVVNAVALINDFKLMPAGDMTEIGERGVNLSGGQKQRISIGRALYSDCDIYVMDDPLSAVDAHVGKHIFNEGIKTYLKGKLVVLITNNLGFLPEADQIVYLDHGKVVAQGSFKKLIKSNDDFKALMDEHGIFSGKQRTQKAAKQEEDKTAHAKDSSQYESEGRESGAVSAGVYAYYIKSAGVASFIAIVLLQLLNAGSTVASQWWLQYWPDDYVDRLKKGLEDRGTLYYIGIYSILNFVGVIFTIGSFILAVKMVLKAAKSIHESIIKRIFSAPIAFFDTTPMGRIISRFSTDMTIVDTQIVISIWIVIIAAFNIVSMIASVALGTYWILIAIPFFVVLYWFIQNRYRKTSIEVQRWEASTRAPLYSHFSETLNGINTIRAYQKEDEFFVENRKRLELHNSVFYALRYTQGWFGFILSLIGALLQIVVFFVIVALKIYVPTSDTSLFTVAISSAPSITLMLKLFATSVTNLEVQMNAVERIQEYTEVPQEPPANIDGSVPSSWPTVGAIEFENFSYRYRDGLPLVLKNLTLKIKGGERIGIVGRTGSGKSTLLGALFRLAEPATGRIIIDGVDTTSIGVEDLRSQLSIIPQEPQLFVGTLRYNLDPFATQTDEEIWEALSISGLKEFVSSLTLKLDEPVQEGGTNFSVGQRQLICLARALLRKSKILVLDEATASVDFDTDVLIQKAIRSSFPNTTLLVIAHRLNTVMDMNRILALEAGEIKEFESPKVLVQNKSSMLYGMIKATGKANAKHLKKLAMGESDIITALKEASVDAIPNSPEPQFQEERSSKKSKK